MNTTLLRTDSSNPDFVALVRLLDIELAERDGEVDNAFYSQFNKIDGIKHAIVCYAYDRPIGCGAIKQYSEDTMEVKRMYTLPETRGKGLAGKVLNALEHWARELGYKKCILETGHKQPEAIALYSRMGYQRIENYGQYAGVDNSLCFEKTLLQNEK